MIPRYANNRAKRAKKTRAVIARSGRFRLSIFKTPCHIYTQITTPDGSHVLASASSTHESIRNESGATGNITTSILVGRMIAHEASKVGIVEVAFDRSGFKYHGRVKALADAAREAGLRF